MLPYGIRETTITSFETCNHFSIVQNMFFDNIWYYFRIALMADDKLIAEAALRIEAALKVNSIITSWIINILFFIIFIVINNNSHKRVIYDL